MSTITFPSNKTTSPASAHDHIFSLESPDWTSTSRDQKVYLYAGSVLVQSAEQPDHFFGSISKDSPHKATPRTSRLDTGSWTMLAPVSKTVEPIVEIDEFQLPIALAHISRAVRDSHNIVDLPPQFDEENSAGYALETWERATRTLLSGAIWVWNQLDYCIPAPAIGPGPNGSIDLDWYEGERTLLLNFPRDPLFPPTLYGDDGAGGFPLEGELDLDKENNWIFAWLAGQ